MIRLLLVALLYCSALVRAEDSQHFQLELVEKQDGWTLYQTHFPNLSANHFFIQRIDFDLVEVGMGYGNIEEGEIYKETLESWWTYAPDLVSVVNAGPSESKVQNPTRFLMPLKIGGELISNGKIRPQEKLMMLAFSGDCPAYDCVSIRPFTQERFLSDTFTNVLVGYDPEDPDLKLTKESDFTIVGIDDFDFSSPILYIVHVTHATLHQATILLHALGVSRCSMMVLTQGNDSQFRSTKITMEQDRSIFPIVLAVRKKIGVSPVLPKKPPTLGAFFIQ